MPDTNVAVSVATEQGGAISRPGQRDALGLATSGKLGAQVVDDGLAQQVPNLDGSGRGSAQPVAVGRENQGIDAITSLQRVQVLGVVQVPQHDSAVLASRGAQGTVRGDGNAVDEASVANVVNVQETVGSLHLPHLHQAIATSRHNQRLVSVRGEANVSDPVSVTGQVGGTAGIVGGSSKVTLQVTTSVPQLDGLVARTRNNQAVVRGEGNRHDVTSVTNKTGFSLARLQVPQAHSLVPRSGDGKLAVRRQGDVLDKVVVATEGALGITKALVGAVQVPDDGSLVYTDIAGVLVNVLMQSMVRLE